MAIRLTAVLVEFPDPVQCGNRDADFVLEGNPDLKSLSTLSQFKALLDLQKKWRAKIIQSDTAFSISDRQLHVEGIDFDKKSNSFYLGSIHKRKIIRVDEHGMAVDFCAPEFEGMTSVFGLKVDSKRNVLWVCSSPMPEMQNFDSTSRSAVFKFDMVEDIFIYNIYQFLKSNLNYFLKRKYAKNL